MTTMNTFDRVLRAAVIVIMFVTFFVSLYVEGYTPPSPDEPVPTELSYQER